MIVERLCTVWVRLAMPGALIALVSLSAACNSAPSPQACPEARPGRAAAGRACPAPASTVTAVPSTIAPAPAPAPAPTTAPAVDLAIAEQDYTESGYGTKTFTIELSESQAAIVGGYEVDGASNGVYKVLCGPGTFETVVTDGFYVVVPSDMAQAELDKRLDEAVQHGWAREKVSRC